MESRFDASDALAVLTLRALDTDNALGASMGKVTREREHAMMSQRCWACDNYLTGDDVASAFSMTCVACWEMRQDTKVQRFQVEAVGNTDEQQATLDSFDRDLFKFDTLGVCVVPSCRRTAYLNKHDACVDCCFPRSCWRTIVEMYTMEGIAADGKVDHDSWDTMTWP